MASETEKPFSRWMRLALDLREKLRLGDTQLIYLWALGAGFIGAITALVFSLWSCKKNSDCQCY